MAWNRLLLTMLAVLGLAWLMAAPASAAQPVHVPGAGRGEPGGAVANRGAGRGRIAARRPSRPARPPSPPTTGADALIGRQTVVRSASGETTGRVHLEGTWWTARTRGEPLHEGQNVRVVALEDLTVIVEPIAPRSDHHE